MRNTVKTDFPFSENAPPKICHHNPTSRDGSGRCTGPLKSHNRGLPAPAEQHYQNILCGLLNRWEKEKNGHQGKQSCTPSLFSLRRGCLSEQPWKQQQ
jgi:hypothetical protein